MNSHKVSGTTNPGVTQKPDNTLKGNWNQIPWNPNNLLKGIHNLEQTEYGASGREG